MSIVSKVFRNFYWPLCRVYARHLGDRPADALLRFLCVPQFLSVLHFWPNFIQPRRFSEKLWSRQLHDRNPKLTLISDKLLVRDYVVRKVGNDCLIPLLWHGEDPEKIPFDELPDKFVIKTNHGCAYNIIVYDKSKLNREIAKQQLQKWLCENFGEETYLGIAWGYKNIKPTILIELFIEENGKAPVDYKFWCFSGSVEFLTIHYDRFEEHKTRIFDRNFEPHELRDNLKQKQWDGELKRPPNFEAMLQIVESLAAEFDFMRVDLYSVCDKIYFSEFTPYPGGVSLRFLPVRQDYLLGEKWK